MEKDYLCAMLHSDNLVMKKKTMSSEMYFIKNWVCCLSICGRSNIRPNFDLLYINGGFSVKQLVCFQLKQSSCDRQIVRS